MLPRRTNWARAWPLTTFYLLAFSLAWLGCLPVLAGTYGVAAFQHPAWLGALLLMALGPTLAAGLTLRWQGEPTAGRLAALLRWRMAPRWYALALALPLVALTATQLLSRWLIKATPVAHPALRGGALVAFVLLSLAINPWEEIGWRGFALPRLQARYSPLVAALLVGGLWGFWHLPLFLLSTGPVAMASLPFGPWLLCSLATSCLMSWLYNRAGGSLVVLSLYHIAQNGLGAAIGVRSYWLLLLVEASLALLLWGKPPRKPTTRE
ncbi:MAG: CPBP family intramembrane glutamic endopeptidase [Janthinobacterium lividum]